jgi:hypothetical protein
MAVGLLPTSRWMADDFETVDGLRHLPNLPTSVPRALTVFNLTEEPWYGRLTHDQLDSLLLRVHSIRELSDDDRAIVESFVRCARDQVCPPAKP